MIRCTPCLPVLLVAALVGGCGGGSSDTPSRSWDMSKEFEIATNPNGPWRYGWASTVNGAFQYFDRPGTDNVRTFWSTNADPNFYFAISRTLPGKTNFDGHTPPTIVPLDTFWMHPGNSGEVAETRWVAPRNGRFTVRAEFTGYSDTSTEAFIFVKGSQIFSGRVNGYLSRITLPATAPFTMASGESIRIVVSDGGNGPFFDSTGASVTITEVR